MLEGRLKEGILKVASEPVPESTAFGTRICWRKTGCFTSLKLFHEPGLFHEHGGVS